MKTNLNDSLRQSLQAAKSSYNPALNEEQGGFILKAGEVYQYVAIRNANTGKPIARGLYTADKAQFANKVLTPCLMAGQELFASFHTHPKGFPAMPSYTDLNELFTGHPVNFIYAPESDTLNMFTCEPSDSQESKAPKTGKPKIHGVTIHF